MRFALNALCGASVLLLSSLSLAPVQAAEPAVDGVMLNRIADAGLKHGEVAETIEYLSDRIGGRMTNSPAMRKAEAWAQDRFKAWGLANVHKEGFEFGRGWWIESNHARVLAPRPIEVKAIPIAWTPATNGTVKAEVIVAPMHAEKDFAEYKGKLKGKIVLADWPAPQKDNMEPPLKRYSGDDISKMDKYELPEWNPERRREMFKFFTFKAKLDAFLAEEGATAWVQMSRLEGRLVHGEGYEYKMGKTPKVPAVEMGAEDYRRIARLAKTGPVTLELNNKVHYDDSDSKAYNVFAEIAGADDKAGFVMAGAHLDSWVAGDGAADNGAGSAVVMEAARILQSLGVKPKRTIRFALWAGEEQGLLGSAAYIEQHLAKRPPPTDPVLAQLGSWATETFPVTTLPEFNSLAAYFNIDNGSGKIRGIHTEGNFAVVPTLKQWLMPFGSMGASAVVASPTGGTDHVLMQRLGLPAFQFIQDPLDYGSRVHHTDLDTFDHLRLDDMRQASVILASLLLQAANAPEPLPRNVVPAEPRVTDPFAYPDPTKKQ
jgi:hypothetical protein